MHSADNFKIRKKKIVNSKTRSTIKLFKREILQKTFSTRTGCILLPCDMFKSSLRHIHDPVLLSLKVEVICFVLSCFPPSLPLFRVPRPHTCIAGESRLSLREGSTAQAAMTSLCYDSCEFHWNKRRLRHIHVKNK